jgi:hypothetical protein
MPHNFFFCMNKSPLSIFNRSFFKNIFSVSHFYDPVLSFFPARQASEAADDGIYNANVLDKEPKSTKIHLFVGNI